MSTDLQYLVEQIADDQARLRILVNGDEDATVVLEARTSPSIAGMVKQRLDEVSQTYYGTLAEDPTEDPSGNAPTSGDFYYNDGSVNPAQKGLRLFNGVDWEAIFADADSVVYGVTTVGDELDSLNSRAVYHRPTKAAADTLAASLPDGATVIADEDEDATPAGVQTRRSVLSGALTAVVSFLKTSMIAWKHGGTGAVWRTLYARLMDLPVSVKDFGAVGDGVTDDTAAIQAALSSGAKHIVSLAGLTFKTSNTLFVTSSDTIVDFNNSKIINTNNSRYALCLVTANIASLNEASLTTILTTLNYGSEIKNSHIKNLVVSMSPTTSGGNNLGVGIVYGKDCTLSNITVLQTNGNGIEVRNSTRCHVDNAKLTPRSYGAFFFMTRDCSIRDSYIAGCARGLPTKMSQSGAPVNFKATRVIVENLTNGLYYAVSGEWKELVLTDDIYQSGHEFVTGNTYTDCTFRSDSGQVKVDLSYWANRFTFDNCTFISATSSAGFNIGVGGNHIGGGGVQGKNHSIDGCKFINGTTEANTCISAGADTLVTNCVFTGVYQRLLIPSTSVTSPRLVFRGNVVSGALLSGPTTDYRLFASESSVSMVVENNSITMAAVYDGVNGGAGLFNNVSNIINNNVRISGIGADSVTSLSGINASDSTIHNNSFYFSDFVGTIYGAVIVGAANVQNNVIGNNGTVGASSRGLYMTSSSIELVKNEGNHIYGTWANAQFANLSQNYPFLNRIKSGSAAPTTGAWARGDVVFNSSPSAGGVAGWTCVAAGTPGTWKAMAALAV